MDLTKRPNGTQMKGNRAFYFIAFLFRLDKAALVKTPFPLGKGLSGFALLSFPLDLPPTIPGIIDQYLRITGGIMNYNGLRFW